MYSSKYLNTIFKYFTAVGSCCRCISRDNTLSDSVSSSCRETVSFDILWLNKNDSPGFPWVISPNRQVAKNRNNIKQHVTKTSKHLKNKMVHFYHNRGVDIWNLIMFSFCCLQCYMLYEVEVGWGLMVLLHIFLFFKAHSVICINTTMCI